MELLDAFSLFFFVFFAMVGDVLQLFAIGAAVCALVGVVGFAITEAVLALTRE